MHIHLYLDEAKASKEVAHYTPVANEMARRCALCIMFRGPSGCTAVKGDISQFGHCDYWAKV